MQLAWRSRADTADSGTTTGDDRSPVTGSSSADDIAARIAASDLATVALAQADPRAFAPLYARYSPIVLNYCRRRIDDPDAAADATSQIFTRALAGLPAFRPNPSRSGSTFRSWLFAIAHNVVIDTRRRHRSHLSLDHHVRSAGEAPSSDPPWLIDPAVSPEDLAIRADEARHVHTMLARLPERQRQIVELRLAELTGAEIAQTLGMSVSAVKSAQFRAYGTLRDLLRPEFQLPPESNDAQR
jgi:RNA polymerase sigma-70 factor (ECF subfamily)